MKIYETELDSSDLENIRFRCEVEYEPSSAMAIEPYSCREVPREVAANRIVRVRVCFPVLDEKECWVDVTNLVGESLLEALERELNE